MKSTSELKYDSTPQPADPGRLTQDQVETWHPMAAGGPGDHPLTDIISYKLDVYGQTCDDLVREISTLVPLDELYGMFDWFDNFSVSEPQREKLEKDLRARLDSLKNQARRDGWEISD